MGVDCLLVLLVELAAEFAGLLAGAADYLVFDAAGEVLEGVLGGFLVSDDGVLDHLVDMAEFWFEALFFPLASQSVADLALELVVCGI
jgi:hypothetical protein